MSAHIDYSEAISELKEMFPAIDRDVIKMVLLECSRAVSDLLRIDGSVDKTVSSLLIMSGDNSPELVQTYFKTAILTHSVQRQKTFKPSETTEKEIQRIEEETGLDLHRAWISRLPNDLLVVGLRFQEFTSSSALRNHPLPIPYKTYNR